MLLTVSVALFGLACVAALATLFIPRQSRPDIHKLILQLQNASREPPSTGPRSFTKNISQLISDSPKLSHDKADVQLFTKEDVEKNFDMHTWQRLAYEDFKATILAKGIGFKKFPCIYATMGYRRNEHCYVFLESDNPSEARNIRIIAPALRAYLEISRSLGPYTSLVIIGSSSTQHKPVIDYNNRFWDMLHGLRIKDPGPWPSEIPSETHSENWTFCFDGHSLFPIALTPAHHRRWSRHASVPIVALQPKWVFDKLLSTPEKRQLATGTVRRLLAEYDQVEVSSDLAEYGIPGTSEVRQLCMLDENESVSCPYQDFDH